MAITLSIAVLEGELKNRFIYTNQGILIFQVSQAVSYVIITYVITDLPNKLTVFKKAVTTKSYRLKNSAKTYSLSNIQISTNKYVYLFLLYN